MASSGKHLVLDSLKVKQLEADVSRTTADASKGLYIHTVHAGAVAYPFGAETVATVDTVQTNTATAFFSRVGNTIVCLKNCYCMIEWSIDLAETVLESASAGAYLRENIGVTILQRKQSAFNGSVGGDGTFLRSVGGATALQCVAGQTYSIVVDASQPTANLTSANAYMLFRIL